MMFNNLIESSSHRKELKRRGSFFLVTTATYGLMLVLTGIASIYAYDARLDEQVYEQVITMLPPEPARAPAATQPERPRSTEPVRSNIPERITAMAPVDMPQVRPDDISAQPNRVLPLPPGPVRIGIRDWDPPLASGTGGPSSSGGSRLVPPTRIVVPDELPPAPQPSPVNKIIVSKGPLNGRATFLPKPIYPPMARQIRLQGQVIVQVLIDEGGRVVSAQAVSGHALLIPEAKKAALQARFTPTMIGDQPVKVSGVITYNFVMQ